MATARLVAIAVLMSLSTPSAFSEGLDDRREGMLVAMLPASMMTPALAPAAKGTGDRALAARPSAEEKKKKPVKSHSLSRWVMRNAMAVSKVIHATGGYHFDGWSDCYGFVKRTWNPILGWLRRHHVKGLYPTELPVGDFPSSAWRPIKSWDALIPGDVLGTVQGHRGGKDVDYGLYGGKKEGVHYQFYNGGGAGPRFRPQTGRYQYYYAPTHELLKRLREK